jgi:hypothetical protein
VADESTALVVANGGFFGISREQEKQWCIYINYTPAASPVNSVVVEVNTLHLSQQRLTFRRQAL